MKNIYEFKDYRKAIKEFLISRKNFDDRFKSTYLAKVINVQQPYVSKVLNGKAHFSSDQLFLTCKHCGFNENERQFLETLHAFQCTGVAERKAALKKDVQKIRDKFTESQLTIKSMDTGRPDFNTLFFSDAVFNFVHTALTVTRYQRNIDLLARDFGIPLSRVRMAIAQLIDMELVEEKGNSLKATTTTLHLEKSDPMYKNWIRDIRLSSLNRLCHSRQDEDYHFSVTFSATKDTELDIRNLFINSLKDIQDLVKDSPCEEVYQMNFDLFSWTNT